MELSESEFDRVLKNHLPTDGTKEFGWEIGHDENGDAQRRAGKGE
jgi:hypothetical protein